MNQNYKQQTNYDNKLTPGAVSTPKFLEATYVKQVKDKDFRLGVIPPPIAKDKSSIDEILGI